MLFKISINYYITILFFSPLLNGTQYAMSNKAVRSTQGQNKAMPNRNSVKRQLKFDKPRYLFTKTHKQKTKTQVFYENNNKKTHNIIIK